MEWAVSGLGLVVVLVTGRDVFHTLWHPGGQGTLAALTMRAIWAATRRRGRRQGVGRLAGPIALVSVVVVWGALTAVGWALVYGPHLPGAFSYSRGLDPASRSDALDALYVSLVTMATLGFGDIVPTDGWLRLLTPVQALSGFGLLTAAVTWALQIYPALSRRRALALRVHGVVRARHGASTAEGAPVPGHVLSELAEAVAAIRVDLTQYSETYYFPDADERVALARAAGALEQVALDASTADDADVRWGAALVLAALDDLARQLDGEFLHVGGERADVLAAFARDHGYEYERRAAA